MNVDCRGKIIWMWVNSMRNEFILRSSLLFADSTNLSSVKDIVEIFSETLMAFVRLLTLSMEKNLRCRNKKLHLISM